MARARPAAPFVLNALAARLDRLLAVCAGAADRAPDAQSIHQMRVWARRSRAAFDLAAHLTPHQAPERLGKLLRQVTRALGAGRDLDVMVAGLRALADDLDSSERDGVENLARRLERRRTAAEESLTDAIGVLSRPEFAHRVSDIEARVPRLEAASLGTQERGAAARLLQERMEEVFAVGNLGPSSSVEELHDARIALRRFRYTVEILQDGAGPDAAAASKPLLAEVKQLQTALGEIHDADVLAPWIARELARSSEELRRQTTATGGKIDSAALGSCAGLLKTLAACLSRQSVGRETVSDRWQGFRASGLAESLCKALAEPSGDCHAVPGSEGGGTAARPVNGKQADSPSGRRRARSARSAGPELPSPEDEPRSEDGGPVHG